MLPALSSTHVDDEIAGRRRCGPHAAEVPSPATCRGRIAVIEQLRLPDGVAVDLAEDGAGSPDCSEVLMGMNACGRALTVVSAESGSSPRNDGPDATVPVKDLTWMVMSAPGHERRGAST